MRAENHGSTNDFDDFGTKVKQRLVNSGSRSTLQFVGSGHEKEYLGKKQADRISADADYLDYGSVHDFPDVGRC